MGNVAQIITAVRKPQFDYPFTNGSMSETTTGTLVAGGVTGVSRQYLPAQGSVYGINASFGGTLTSGTVTFTPVINGTPQPAFVATTLTAGARGASQLGDARVYPFNAGDTIGLLYTTSALAPAGLAVKAELLVLFESVEL